MFTPNTHKSLLLGYSRGLMAKMIPVKIPFFHNRMICFPSSLRESTIPFWPSPTLIQLAGGSGLGTGEIPDGKYYPKGALTSKAGLAHSFPAQLTKLPPQSNSVPQEMTRHAGLVRSCGTSCDSLTASAECRPSQLGHNHPSSHGSPLTSRGCC